MTTNNNNILFSQKAQSNIHHIQINGPIEEASNYLDVLTTIRTASANDEINIYFNTPGGYVDTAVQFKSAMSTSEATIIGHIESICHSAGTIIALACDSLVVHPHALMLFHTYTGGGWGKSDDLMKSVIAQDSWIKKLMETSYEEFMSQEEIELLFKNQDFWFEAEEIAKRWEKVLEWRELLVEEEQKALREQIKEQLS